MSRLHLRAPSPALMVSMIALIVALGGTSYAAYTLPKNSVGTSQLRNKAVTTKKIRNGAVTRSKMNFRGVTVPKARTAANATALGGHPASAYLFTGTSGQTLRIVGNAGQPSFQNGWTDLDSGYAAAAFYLNPIRRVH